MLWIASLACCCFGGCGESIAPVAALPPIDPAIEASMVTGATYDWPVTSQGFQIAKPPRFTFIDQLTDADRQRLRQRLEAPAQPGDAAADQQALNEAIGAIPPTLDVLWQTPPGTVAGQMAYAMNAAGDHMVTVGERVRVWHVATGRQVSDAEVPEPAVQAVLYDVDEQFAWVAGQRTVYRIELASGRVAEQIRGLRSAIADWQIDPNTGGVVGVYRTGGLFRVDPHADPAKITATALPSSMQHVSISPDGHWLTGWTSMGAVVAELEEDVVVNQQRHSEAQIDQVLATVCDDHVACWVTPHRVFYNWMQHLREDVTVQPQAGSWVEWQLLAAVPERTGPWPGCLLMHAVRPDADGKPQHVLFQMQPSSGTASAASVIDGPPPRRIVCDPTTAYVALWQDDGVRVVRRAVWPHNTTSFLYGRTRQWLQEGKLDQLDETGRLIRAYGGRRLGYTPEALYQFLAATIGAYWTDAETSDSGSEQLAMLEAWRDGGSELALCASAIRHVSIGWRARGTGSADTVTPQGWDVLFDRLSRAGRDIDQVLQMPQPPAVAYAQRIQIAKAQEGPIEAQGAIVQRAVEAYPAESMVHEQMVHWLLPRWGGATGESAGYASAIADLVGGPSGDAIYVACAASLLDMFGPEYFYTQTRFDVDRMRRGILAYLDQTPGDRNRLKRLLRIMQYRSDEPVVAAIRNYYQCQFCDRP